MYVGVRTLVCLLTHTLTHTTHESVLFSCICVWSNIGFSGVFLNRTSLGRHVIAEENFGLLGCGLRLNLLFITCFLNLQLEGNWYPFTCERMWLFGCVYVCVRVWLLTSGHSCGRLRNLSSPRCHRETNERNWIIRLFRHRDGMYTIITHLHQCTAMILMTMTTTTTSCRTKSWWLRRN